MADRRRRQRGVSGHGQARGGGGEQCHGALDQFVGGGVHEAINDYADALGIPRDLPIPSPEERPQRPAPPAQDRRSRSPKGVRREEPPKIGTRITPLTDTRLAALCELTGDGPQGVVNTALTIWMNRKRIRGSGTDSAAISA
jgi:hypothetical protein